MESKEDIKAGLQYIFENLNAYLKTVDDAAFKKSVNGKWSIAQQIDHLSISNNITALTFHMPKPILKQLFKTNNRPNFSYDEVVWRYQLKLSTGAKASLPFQPKISLVPVRPVVDALWKNSCNTLLKAIDSWTEEELDTFLIPHPIIGKITARELLYFTVYHVQHHLNTIKAIR